MTTTSGEPPPADRRLGGHRGLGARVRVRLRAGGARGRLLARRGHGDEHHRLRRGRPVRGGRLRGDRAGVAGHHPADGPAQRAPPALFRGAVALAPRRAATPASGDGPPPDRRVVRAVDQPLPAARPDRRARLLDRGGRRDVHPVEPRHARRRDPRGADPGSGAPRHRRHLPGRHDRPGRRADHGPARAGRGHRRGGRGRGRGAGDEHRDRHRRRRDHRAAGRPARPGAADDAVRGDPRRSARRRADLGRERRR